MGHGVDTLGKRSPVWEDGTQLLEWEFTRDIGAKFYYLLFAAGISAIRFPSYDTDMLLEDRSALVNRLYNQYKDRYFVYLVSIHGNAFPDERVRGVEAFTSPGTTMSDRICTEYLKSLEDMGWPMRYDESDGDIDKEARFWMLTKTLCPAILTENGFYTNREECRMMLDPFWRKRIALQHLHAAVRIELNHKYE